VLVQLRGDSRSIINSFVGYAENRPIMKRILSEVLRRRNGVERRKCRAGALRIEFIERSRNESLGIECVFAVSDGEGVERSEGLEDGVLASGAQTRDTDGRLETLSTAMRSIADGDLPRL
jgi:hypothetical protein